MLPKGAYNPNETEEEILKYWLENNLYAPEYKSEDQLSTAYIPQSTLNVRGEASETSRGDIRKTYTNILPPPNANGNLHLGHMSGYAYQDLMGRYQRMLGKKVLLLPGKDHAGIQTEVVYERELEKKGKTKLEIGREEFYKQCFDFCMENGRIATEQEQKLGLSADFDRELFTLDPKIVSEVLQTFIDMYHDELIYRDKRLINWCVRCQSALADIDTEYKDSVGKFFYFKYGFTEPEPYAVEVKNKYSGKEVEVKIERYKGMDYTNKEGESYEWPFDYYGELEGEINSADGMNLDVIALGFDEGIKPSEKVKGKAIGIMMRLDKDYKLIVVNEENTELDLEKELDWQIQEFSKYYAGLHIIKFDEYPDDKFYTNGFILATARPETKFGDTAVVVHPDDARYKDWVGKKVEVLTLNGPATLDVIADKAIDPEFGTGIMKLTPAHAPDDWDIATRHPDVGFPEKQVINFDGKLNHLTGKYEGMTIAEAREAMIPDMKKLGMLVKLDENYKQRIQICERCKHQIEPLISYQWFVDTKPLKAKAKELVESGITNIMPEGKKNVYLNWMDTPEDWCITRQLWWGYRVPVWYKEQPKEYITETGEVKEQIGDKVIENKNDYSEFMKVQVESPGDGWIQDEDVLDTWFSSGQWPVVTLLAGKNPPVKGDKGGLSDFEEFYPTQVMETGWDILIFWVTRMMLLCPYKASKVHPVKGGFRGVLENNNLAPFKDVYLHGLVLDEKGQKMSKSKGNGIDPFEMMNKFGTDALRLSFVVGNKVGQNYRLYEKKIEGFRNYCNKIWNVSKFALMNIGEDHESILNAVKDPSELTEKEDLEMIEHIHGLIEDTTRRMETFNFGVAAGELYESIWHTFADVYLEKIKPRTYTKDKEGNLINQSPEEQKSRNKALWVLWYSLDKYLRMLHPFIPFITERIWREIPKLEGESKTIMYAKWPKIK